MAFADGTDCPPLIGTSDFARRSAARTAARARSSRAAALAFVASGMAAACGGVAADPSADGGASHDGRSSSGGGSPPGETSLSSGSSSSGGTSSSGGGSSSAPIPDAYVNASLDTGSSATTCDAVGSSSFLVIGSDMETDGNFVTMANPQRVEDGATEGGTVSIACTVEPTADGQFLVQLSAALSATQLGSGGSIQITGTIGASGSPSNVQGSFVTMGNDYTDDDCTITFPAQPPGGPLVSGRIWAHVDCPSATELGAATTDGNPIQCDASADFVFENCTP